MSSTRRNTTGEFKQNRFASSPEFNRGLMANLVAKRCGVLDSAEDRALIWFLQLLSHQSGGLERLCADLRAQFPERIATPAMREFGMRPGQVYSSEQVKILRDEMRSGAFPLKGEIQELCDLDAMRLLSNDLNKQKEIDAMARRDARRFPSKYPASVFVVECNTAAESGLERHLMALCLDPATAVSDGAPWYFPTLVSTLREYMESWIEAQTANAVATSLGKQLHEALDYTLQTGEMSFIEGAARFGKSHAAKDWCDRHPGRARYVELESNYDELSFLRAIARALGVSNGLNSKAQELRQRIEDTLQCGDLVIVFDEAHYLWPNLIDPRSLPVRINWIMTALVNKGVSVALVTTPQFLLNQKEFERRTRWASEQLVGRIGHYEKLPEILTPTDLRTVAGALAPDTDKQTVEALALYAESSQKYLAGIRHVVNRATFIAGRDGRKSFCFNDVKRAIREAVIPSDNTLATALTVPAKTPRRRVSRVVAGPMQPAFVRAATPLPGANVPGRETTPTRQFAPVEMETTPV